MTSELEKQFFDTFELRYDSCTDNFFNPCRFECDECPHCEERYPQITDRILLELICYLSRYRLVLVPDYACFKTIEELKENILKCAMKFITSNAKPMFYVQDIQKLFKEVN